jgi:hypothetical protein
MTAQNNRKRLAGKVAIVTGMARVSDGPKRCCLWLKAPRSLSTMSP